MVKETMRNGFRRRDYLLIGVLWSPSVVLPWVEKWHELVIPVYVSGMKTVSRGYVNFMIDARIGFMCIMAVIVAIFSDLKNMHYTVWSICVVVFTGAQIYGLIIYYTGPYEAGGLVWWLSSVLFIGRPVERYLIFSQNRHAYRFQTHLILTVCQLSEVLTLYGLFWMRTTRYPATFLPVGAFQAMPWLTIASFIAIITMIIVCRRYSLVGNPRKHTFKASVRAVYHSIKRHRKTEKEIKFWLLAGLIFPLVIPICTHYAVSRMDLNPDGSINIEPKTENVFLIGSIVGLFFVEALLYGIRKLSMKLSDVLSLGLPLFFYLSVAIVTYIRLGDIRALQDSATRSLEGQIQRGEVFAGPIPTTKLSVIDFYNTLNETVELISPNFVMEGPLVPNARIGIGIKFSGYVPVDVIFNPAGAANETERAYFDVMAELNRIHSFIIFRNNTSIGLHRIYDHADIKPDIEPLIVIMNSFMELGDDHHRILVWEEKVEKDVGFFDSYPAFTPSTSIVVHVPIGGVKVSFEDLEDTVEERSEDTTVNVVFTEPLVVYAFLITQKNGHWFLDSYELMRVSIQDDAFTIPKVQHDPVMLYTMAVMGGAFPTLLVALNHHFWMDCPVKMQATLMAICMTSHHLVRRLVNVSIKRLESGHALSLVILMIISIVWHSIIAYLYFYHFKFGYSSDEERFDDLTAKSTNLSPKSHRSLGAAPKRSKVTFEEDLMDPIKPVGDL